MTASRMAFFTVGAAIVACSVVASAEDAGITIQTSLGGYAKTQPLTPAITSQLKACTDTDKPEEIKKVLRQLRDGDLLVLAVHSNPGIFAMGGEKVEWASFWSKFAIPRPPRLSAVIIGGCMSKEVRKGGQTTYQPITTEQVKALRGVFNAELLFVPKGTIHMLTAINDTNGLLQSMLGGKKLSEINLQGRWQHDVSPRWKWNTITLSDLRTADRESEAYDAGARLGRMTRIEGSGFTRELMNQTYSKYNQEEATREAFKKGYRDGSQMQP